MADYFEDVNILINKYELLLYENKSIYFDIEEFEKITYHYMLDGRFDKAAEVVDRAKLCYPDDNEVDFIRAKVLIAKENFSEALPLLDKLESQEQEWSSVNILRGRIYITLDNIDYALYEFRIALTKEPEEKREILLNIVDILIDSEYFDYAGEFLDEIEEPDAETLFRTALFYDRSDDFCNAVEFYEKSLDEDPFNERTWEALGLFYDRNELYAKALESFDFALTVDDKSESALLSKANTLMQIEKYDEAEKILSEILDRLPENVYALCCLADCYEKKSDFLRATEYYIKVLAIDPEFSDAYWGLSNVLIMQNDCESALTAIDKALEIEPDCADFWLTRGEIFILLGAKSEALHAYRKSAELRPDPETKLAIARILATYSFDDAIKELEKASNEFPDNARITTGMAIVYYKKGDSENCVKFIEKALRHDRILPFKLLDYCPEAAADPALAAVFEKYAN